MYQSPHGVRHDGAQVREVLRHALGIVILSAVFLAVAAVWVSTCGGSVADALSCGTPQRTLLALGAPAILLVGAVRAFVRTYQLPDRGHAWLAWHFAAWTLLALMVVVATASAPALAGPAVFS